MSLTRPVEPPSRIAKRKQMQRKIGRKLAVKGPTLSFPTRRLKNPCYEVRLSDADQERAAEADLASTLFMLEDKLKCLGCGKMVGAKKATMGSFYEPYPRPHERPKATRQPGRKRGCRK